MKKTVRGCASIKTPQWKPCLPFTKPTVEAWGTSSFTGPSFERKMQHFVSKIKYFQKIWQFISPNLTAIFQKVKILKKKCYNIISQTSVFLWKIYSQDPSDTPLLQQFIHSQVPKFRNPGCTYLPKKSLGFDSHVCILGAPNPKEATKFLIFIIFSIWQIKKWRMNWLHKIVLLFVK